MLLEDLTTDGRVDGLIPGQPAIVLATQWHGGDALEVTFKTDAGALHQRVLYRSDETRLAPASDRGRAFDAAASDFKLAAEASRISLAGLSDPMLAVTTSDVQPLPHQIRAVYEQLLPRTPLRYLLADDPGAGKTIMAGLYIKELYLRADVQRCLIVAPGGLVEQWQDELAFKFGLHFDLLNAASVDAAHENPFETHPFLITRMDQLSRNPDLQDLLGATTWDLVVVDEAHRMGAHWFGTKLQKTKRFLLGELLGSITRHLLLMTATPHSGNEEDFQLFLTLLDRDRFEGRHSSPVDTSDVMRHLVKEDLLTFEGRPLFPERIAETVPYRLTAAEYDLYDRVTRYVRDGMNRAERLDGKRRNTVGFALTVLQRRLASSPEAILQSLVRRSKRLADNRRQLAEGRLIVTEATVDLDGLDADDFTADEVEALEEEVLDAATAASTVAELDAELAELADLTQAARRVRSSGADRKWTELSTILQNNVLVPHQDGTPRKLIVFTEHRDTLTYLTQRIRSLIGRPEAVLAIHGGVARQERRRITEEFSKNPDCQLLLATDAAGEGLNLQAAHLMVNYDLPWNPNRIEQRFGRIHRIGQEHVCRLWNLVADNTREGEVFTRLLAKVEQQRVAYGGRVFDVLGAAFTEVPLRTLLREAIQYGERPDVRAQLDAIIDRTVGEGLPELLAERALASDQHPAADLAALRAAMDEARARRLQPHYIELAFLEAFRRLGGRLARREPGRYEISHVPVALRADRQPSGGAGPRASAAIATRYERVTFDLDQVQPPGLARADLLAPGHPLHDAVLAHTVAQLSGALATGAVLVSADLDEPRLLVGVVEEVVDATGAPPIARRFEFAEVDESGRVTPAGPAPYLDCVAAPDSAAVRAARSLAWLPAAERSATSWLIAHELPRYLAEVVPRRAAELARTRQLVTERLAAERERLALEAAVAAEKERAGSKPRESSDSLVRKAAELDERLVARLAQLDLQAQMSTRAPRIVTAALIVPLAMVQDDVASVDRHPRETKAVERRGVDLVLAAERALGRAPVEQPFNNKGFDILSTAASGDTYRIEVKARIEGATDFFVTHSEVILGRNAAPRYRLALVRVSTVGRDLDEVVYLDDPFAGVHLGGFDAVGHTGNWARTWAKGRLPF